MLRIFTWYVVWEGDCLVTELSCDNMIMDLINPCTSVF